MTEVTVVLVHGAFADASSWNGVIERLLAAGVKVTVKPHSKPTLPSIPTTKPTLPTPTSKPSFPTPSIPTAFPTGHPSSGR